MVIFRGISITLFIDYQLKSNEKASKSRIFVFFIQVYGYLKTDKIKFVCIAQYKNEKKRFSFRQIKTIIREKIETI